MAAENRLQVYPPKPIHEALTKMAEERGVSVSAVVVSLLEQAMAGTALAGSSSSSTDAVVIARLDGLAERLEAIGATLPEMVEGEQQPPELAAFLAEMRTEIQAIGARVLRTEALADRAVMLSARSYILTRNVLQAQIGAEKFQALQGELPSVFKDAYEAAVQQAEEMAFGEGA